MSNSGGIITAPVSIQDVHDVLGESSYNLETLCKSSKINKWSKFKPVRFHKDFDLTSQDWANTNYGMERVRVDTSNLGCSEPFIYKPPSSGYPCRIGDFNKYYHHGIRPITVTELREVSIDSNNSYAIYIDSDVTQEVGNIQIKNIFSYEGAWYPGVLVRNVPKNIAVFKTTSYNLNSDSDVFDITPLPIMSNWTKGQTIDVFPVLSQTVYTGNADNSPAIPTMYYLGSGQRNIPLVSSYIPGSGYEVIGYPVITYTTTWQMGEEMYWIRNVKCTLKNSGTYTSNLYIVFNFEGEDGILNESERNIIAVSPGSQRDVSISTSIYYPTYYNSYLYLGVNVTEIQTGNGGSIFYEEFDLINNEWVI